MLFLTTLSTVLLAGSATARVHSIVRRDGSYGNASEPVPQAAAANLPVDASASASVPVPVPSSSMLADEISSSSVVVAASSAVVDASSAVSSAFVDASSVAVAASASEAITTSSPTLSLSIFVPLGTGAAERLDPISQAPVAGASSASVVTQVSDATLTFTLGSGESKTVVTTTIQKTLTSTVFEVCFKGSIDVFMFPFLALNPRSQILTETKPTGNTKLPGLTIPDPKRLSTDSSLPPLQFPQQLLRQRHP